VARHLGISVVSVSATSLLGRSKIGKSDLPPAIARQLRAYQQDRRCAAREFLFTRIRATK
jgi:hypothetical protein